MNPLDSLVSLKEKIKDTLVNKKGESGPYKLKTPLFGKKYGMQTIVATRNIICPIDYGQYKAGDVIVKKGKSVGQTTPECFERNNGFSECVLVGECVMDNSVVADAVLMNATLRDSVVKNSVIDNTVLKKSRINDSILEKTELAHVDATNCVLKEVLLGADLREHMCPRMILSECDFYNLVGDELIAIYQGRNMQDKNSDMEKNWETRIMINSQDTTVAMSNFMINNGHWVRGSFEDLDIRIKHNRKDISPEVAGGEYDKQFLYSMLSTNPKIAERFATDKEYRMVITPVNAVAQREKISQKTKQELLREDAEMFDAVDQDKKLPPMPQLPEFEFKDNTEDMTRAI